jgi:hypothetical protein
MNEQQALYGAEYYGCQAYKLRKRSNHSIYKYAYTYMWTREPINALKNDYDEIVLIADFEKGIRP